MEALKRLVGKLIDSAIILLQVLYLVRFPLLTFCLIVAFMPVTLFLWLRTLMANLYDLDTFLKSFWFSLSAFLLAFSAIANLKMILLYSGERIEFDQETRKKLSSGSTKFALRQISFFLVLVLTFVLLSGVFLFNPEDLSSKLTGCAVGFAGAVFLLFLADTLQRLINRKHDAEKLDRFLFPFRNPLAGWADRNEYFADLSRSVFRPRFLEPLFKKVPSYIGLGYLRYGPKNNVEVDGDGRAIFNPAHFTTIALFFFFLVVYIIVGWSSYLFPGLTRRTLEITAISYLMVLLTVLVWGLTGLSFFLDRYRFPVIVIILPIYLLASITSYDFVFTVNRLPDQAVAELAANPLTPAAVLDAKPAVDRTSDYAIVVAANGGGIQASAWTARVLTGIEKNCRAEFGLDFHGCGERIRLISSVSGGSLGAMYFVNAYGEAGLPDDPALDEVAKRASDSSLDAAAWGLVYPDFLRSLVPYYHWSYGRGHALEDEWAKDDKSLKVGLTSWREGIRRGWRPASIFNATVVETGERMMISTSDQCEKNGQIDECSERARQLATAMPARPIEPISAPYGRKSFYSFLPGYDIPIVTAVRLSASFPYVTPAPRADLSDTGDVNYKHVADGGYYDNYGVSSLLEWLNEGLTYKTSANLKNILIVQIRGDQVGVSEKDGASPRPYYQSLAPLLTLLNVRNTGQLSRNDAELEIFMNYWRSKGVNIETVIFEFLREKGDDSPPLSWHLSKAQKVNIETAWQKVADPSVADGPWNKLTRFIKARTVSTQAAQ